MSIKNVQGDIYSFQNSLELTNKKVDFDSIIPVLMKDYIPKMDLKKSKS